MGLVEWNCCDDVRVETFNICNRNNKKQQRRGSQQAEVLYSNHINQIVIVNTPQIDYPQFINLDNIGQTDIYTIIKQGEDLVFASYTGVQILESNDDLKMCESVIGKKIEEVLPEYTMKFFPTIYEQTLDGHHLQLSIMWNGVTFLLRTFPVIDHKKRILAANVVMAPFTGDFNGDINKFILKGSKQYSATPASAGEAGKAQKIVKGVKDGDHAEDVNKLKQRRHSGMMDIVVHGPPKEVMK